MRSIGSERRTNDTHSHKIESDLEIARLDQMIHETAVLRARFQVQPQDKSSVRRKFMYRMRQVLDVPVQAVG